MFASEQECLEATLAEGSARLERALGEAVGLSESADLATGPGGPGSVDERWLSRVRAGLVGLLGFLDDEPAWGRTLFLRAPELGVAGLACEGRALALMNELLAGAPSPSPAGPRGCALSPELMGELVLGGVLAIIRARLCDGGGERLVELAPGLTAFVSAPFLGEGAVRAELAGRAACEGFSVDRAAGPGGEGGRRVRRSIISRGKRSGGL